MRRATPVIVNEVERQTLERWSRGRRTPARLVLRAKIVLGAADGKENLGIAEELGVGRLTVARWRLRFTTHGLSCLEKDAPRGGRKPTIRSQVAQRIVEATTQSMNTLKHTIIAPQAFNGRPMVRPSLVRFWLTE